MASMGSFDICTSHKDYYLLAVALRSFFLVIATHLLAGEVDTSTLSQEAAILPRLSWLLRYFNPLNLSWRYYSIFAYRLAAAQSWGEKQMALINYEAHPCKAPVPYIVTESVDLYHVRRLEPSGFFSSQGLLTASAAYQGFLAVQYTISTAGVTFLPNITMPLAILGLLRVPVYPWIASKVYVDPYEYPSLPSVCKGDIHISPYKSSRLVVTGWVGVLTFVVFLSLWPFYAYPAIDLPKQIFDFSTQIFYVYVTISEIVFHGILLWHGPRAWGNRVMFFDHWIYKAQTIGFMVLLGCMLVIGIADFIEHDYYRQCA